MLSVFFARSPNEPALCTLLSLLSSGVRTGFECVRLSGESLAVLVSSVAALSPMRTLNGEGRRLEVRLRLGEGVIVRRSSSLSIRSTRSSEGQPQPPTPSPALKLNRPCRICVHPTPVCVSAQLRCLSPTPLSPQEVYTHARRRKSPAQASSALCNPRASLNWMWEPCFCVGIGPAE
jgi:hypothetical protein